MTPPMTPREKVIAILDERTTVGGTSAYKTGSVNSDELSGLILTALASGSGDHAELARLAEEATPGPWKGRQPAYSEGATYIESELPCINGLSAWFSVALVPTPSPEELGYSDGAIDSDANAAFIAAANPATVLALLAENAALRGDLAKTERDYSELRDSYDRVSNKLCVDRAHGSRETKRATEAERKLAEAVEIASKLSAAISWLDYPFIDNNTSDDELRSRVGFMMKDAEQARARLSDISKEAERG